MARRVSLNIPVPTAVAAGASISIEECGSSVWAWTSGTFVATFQLQLSQDGVLWTNEGTAITVPGQVEITKLARFIRANTTVYTSGTPTCLLVAMHSVGA